MKDDKSKSIKLSRYSKYVSYPLVEVFDTDGFSGTETISRFFSILISTSSESFDPLSFINFIPLYSLGLCEADIITPKSCPKFLSKIEKTKPVAMFCTGGIRCEKASSYLLHNGFKDVNQLQGGIIQYAHDIKEQGIDSRFKGKNFVFDDRLGERVTDDVISSCHVCDTSCDDHTDCKNDACHILFIQCTECSELLNGCCSKECKDFALLPLDEQKALRKDPERIISRTFFDSRVKPKLDR